MRCARVTLSPMRASLSSIAVVVGAAAACSSSSLPAPAPVVCEVEQSADPCFRCQAQRCGSQLDQCYGAGFHEGRSVAVPVTSRCAWNSATGQYDQNCSLSGGLGADAALDYRNGHLGDGGLVGAPAVPCGPVAVCMQSCGCGAECTSSCTRPGDGAMTVYYANDPRYPTAACALCVTNVLGPCIKRSCATECAVPGDAGP
jgi:hypothetical protein